MKINYKQKALKLGEFIASVYDAHDKYKAEELCGSHQGAPG